MDVLVISLDGEDVDYTVKPLLTDTPNSGQSPYNGQHAMYQLTFVYD